MTDKNTLPKTYQRLKHRLFFFGLFLDIIFLLTLIASGLSVFLRDFSFACTDNFYAANGIYAAAFYLAMYIFHFPLRYVEGFAWEHQFALSNQTFPQWLADDIKKSLINFVVFIIVLEVVYMFLKNFPDTWWIGAGAFWLFLTLVLARITPNILIPLFYKYSPVEDQNLRESVLKLFKESRIKIKDAYLINFSSKTKKANAFICGLGQSRRVVLSDTLVSRFSVAEIETVIAHEIGHYKHHDILKLTVMHSAVVFLGFYLIDLFLKGAIRSFGIDRIDDIAFFPVVALAMTVFGFLIMPLLNGFSRSLEVAADAFSLKLTGKPADFISMIRKLGEMNLADFEPNRWIEFFFYSHPSIAKRITFAEHYSVENKGA